MTDNNKKLELEIELLKKDFAQMGKILDRFDDAVTKLQEVANNLDRIAIIHGEELKKLYEEVDSVKQEVKNLRKIIDTIRAWRWYVIGISTVLGFIAAKINWVQILFQ